MSCIRPIPIVKGRAAEIFYKTINQGEISSEQQDFLNKCRRFYVKQQEVSE